METTHPPHRTRRAGLMPLAAALVLVMVALIVVMVVSGMLLAQAVGTIEQNAAGLDWAEALVGQHRLLLLVLAGATFGMMVLLTLALAGMRRLVENQTAGGGAAASSNGHSAPDNPQLQSLLNFMNEGVLYTENGRVAFTNRALSRLTGWEADELVHHFSSPGSNGTSGELRHLHAVISHAIAQGGIWQGPFRLHTRQGEELDVAVTGVPVEGIPGSVVMLVRDDSGEKRLRDQKSRFVTNASHELRTPLANLKQRLYLIRRQPEKLEEHLQVVESMTDFMQQFVAEMIEMGKFERGAVMLDRENIALQEVVREAVNNFSNRAERRSVNLTCDLPENPITVYGDARRLRQVVTNLLSNAMNHTKQDGRVDVKVVLEAPSGDHRRYVQVVVQDDGVGITEDMLAQVFQPFSVASQGLVSGTVLGLSLAREIVELHSGEITAYSEAGQGACFTFRLPVVS